MRRCEREAYLDPVVGTVGASADDEPLSSGFLDGERFDMSEST
jgi:hypothetical protein